jgi:hypothetical protein
MQKICKSPLRRGLPLIPQETSAVGNAAYYTRNGDSWGFEHQTNRYDGDTFADHFYGINIHFTDILGFMRVWSSGCGRLLCQKSRHVTHMIHTCDTSGQTVVYPTYPISHISNIPHIYIYTYIYIVRTAHW